MDKMLFVWDNIFLSGTKLILPGTKNILSVQMAWALVKNSSNNVDLINVDVNNTAFYNVPIPQITR